MNWVFKFSFNVAGTFEYKEVCYEATSWGQAMSMLKNDYNIVHTSLRPLYSTPIKDKQDEH